MQGPEEEGNSDLCRREGVCPSCASGLNSDTWPALRSMAHLLHLNILQACAKVCAFVRKQVEKIRHSMDGKNVDTVLMEFGVRFHRLVYEHLQQYSYSCMGGMLAICDVAEYRKCAKEFKVSGGLACERGQASLEGS